MAHIRLLFHPAGGSSLAVDLPAFDGTNPPTYQYFVHPCGSLTQAACAQVPNAATCQLTMTNVPYINGQWDAAAPPEWNFVNGHDISDGVFYSLAGQENCQTQRTANVIFVCGKANVPVSVLVPAGTCQQNYTITTRQSQTSLSE